MPPPLPDRYRLEVRLGRDHDIEEWLAADLNLDRPVLIRILGPDASPKRRREFVETVKEAAAVSHPHLEPIYAAEEVPGGAYAVSEWGGGLTLAARLEGGHTLEPAEFLANASGLADALATIHEAGLIHGAIDAGSILYTVGRPARLGGFGRPRRYLLDQGLDVSDLAAVLEQSLTGLPPGGPPPSELVDGLPAAVDRALGLAGAGKLTASRLARELAGIPPPPPPQPDTGGPRRGVLLATVLVAVAVGLIVLGRVLAGDTGVPVLPGPPIITPAVTTTTTILSGEATTIVEAAAYDPFGDGGENDGSVSALVDGELATSWRTERYRAPLASLKPGVGVTVAVQGEPGSIEIAGVSRGTGLQVRWADGRPQELDEWEVIATVRAEATVVTVRLPARTNGHWLIWFTELPPQTEGEYWTSVAEIRFGS
jgi:serine/threonine protein kinase